MKRYITIGRIHKTQTLQENTNTELVEELCDEIHYIRSTFLHILPFSLDDNDLGNYYNIKSSLELSSWEHKFIDKVVDEVDTSQWDKKMKSNEFKRNLNSRGECPLCHSKPYGAWNDWEAAEYGYTIPEGLRRHLTGYGKMNQCVVVKSIFNYVFDSTRAKKDYEG